MYSSLKSHLHGTPRLSENIIPCKEVEIINSELIMNLAISSGKFLESKVSKFSKSLCPASLHWVIIPNSLFLKFSVNFWTFNFFLKQETSCKRAPYSPNIEICWKICFHSHRDYSSSPYNISIVCKM